MDYECNCRVCNNNDAPEMHEICECYDCHESGSHETPSEWASECDWCDELARDEAAEAERERTNDLQKGDSQ